MENKSVIVTGAAGFTGYSLTKELDKRGYKVYAVLRPESAHNNRIGDFSNVIPCELDISKIRSLTGYIHETPYAMIHLVWEGGRYNLEEQQKNIIECLDALEVAKMLGCKRFVSMGSQAEYGATNVIQDESLLPNPFTAYGAAKVAACYLSRYRANELGIEWIWARIFSLYGLYEPNGRMLPALVRALKSNEPIELTSCRQNWDYLYVSDAAEAIISLAESGKRGEIYNIANGSYRSLKAFVEEAAEYFNSTSKISYGSDPVPFVSLQPSIAKIKNDTGWEPRTSFLDGITAGYI